jgi:hypothetical protein
VIFPVDGDHLMCANQPEEFAAALTDATRLVDRRARSHAGRFIPRGS